MRERKKLATKDRIAEAAERLFSVMDYEDVSTEAIARAADVSESTVRNYYPGKSRLVLDKADEIQEQYIRAVLERGSIASPAQALRSFAHDDGKRFLATPNSEALGQYPALCARSETVRRFALQMRSEQAENVAGAIAQTTLGIRPTVVHVYSVVLISALQSLAEEIGRHVVANSDQGAAGDELGALADALLDDAHARYPEFVLDSRLTARSG